MTTSVSQTSLNFLQKLRENNHKDWMQDHKKEYLASDVSLKELYKEILMGLEVTDEIEKQKIFRINRDVRNFIGARNSFEIWHGITLACRIMPTLKVCILKLLDNSISKIILNKKVEFFLVLDFFLN